MQWVETTGRTIEDAKEAALDQLGIDESEAEFEVLEEPKTGLFGRLRSEARVRARVAPKSPRPKQERRPRRPRSGRDERPRGGGGGNGGAGGKAAAGKGGSGTAGGEAKDGAAEAGDRPAKDSSRRSRSGQGGQGQGGQGGRSRGKTDGGSPARSDQEGNDMTTDEVVPVGAQADMVTEFLEGLLQAMDLEGTVARTEVDEETIELGVDGADLGLLIGPKGQTLTAVHELSRTVLQRRAPGRHEGRVRIDIGGYRQRRAEALARFVAAQADLVRSEGTARKLEPMNAADRKIVHDTINEIDGVHTISEGADPDRRVVLVPDTDEA